MGRPYFVIATPVLTLAWQSVFLIYKTGDGFPLIMPPLPAYLIFSLFTVLSYLQKRRLPCGRRLFCICYTKSGKFFTTAAQRGHSSGCWASLPTVGSTFQQRRHLAPLAGRTATVSSLPTSTRT